MTHPIGATYKYPNSARNLVLTEVSENGCVFVFSCGHRVTDSVFEDLTPIRTVINKKKQLKLFK